MKLRTWIVVVAIGVLLVFAAMAVVYKLNSLQGVVEVLVQKIEAQPTPAQATESPRLETLQPQPQSQSLPQPQEADFSQVPLPTSGKTITYEEFSAAITAEFNGWNGSVVERVVPTKADVEAMVEFAKPFLVQYEQAKNLALFGLLLDTEWAETSIALCPFGGVYYIAAYTTDGWYVIDPQLAVAPLPAFSYKPSLLAP